MLELYGPVLRTLASAAGPHVEVVLHNLDDSDVDLDHTIMAITNGHVTGRKVGGFANWTTHANNPMAKAAE